MSFLYQKNDKEVVLTLTGDMVCFDDASQRDNFFKLFESKDVGSFRVEARELVKWDSSVSAFLYKTIKFCQDNKISFVLNLPSELKSLLDLSLAVDRKPLKSQEKPMGILEEIGTQTIYFLSVINKGFKFFIQSLFSFVQLLKGKAVMRLTDFISVLDSCGPKALLIVSLISFMVGLILAFVGSIQLKTFGAQIYVASLVTIGMIRIMGAIMVGVIMAGRTGASYAATIGTMQVNEELDALKTMGIPSMDFLVLPRILALVISMPILVMVSDFMGMLGGAFVGTALLEISPEEYWNFAWKSFGLQNFLVGIFHGVVFAFVISLCGCYYGINCGRNADSVGVATTKAVVSSIVWMIILTGIITLLCEVFGI